MALQLKKLLNLSKEDFNLMPSVSRNKEHELVMICIYDALTHISLGDEFSVEETMESIFEEPFENISLFAKQIVVKSLKNIDEIESVYQAKMPKWKFARLNRLEQAILLMSYTQAELEGKDSKRVIIDVAVRLSKKYLDESDYKFVNAILDNVL